MTERSNRISQSMVFDIGGEEVPFLFTEFFGVFNLLVSIVWKGLGQDHGCSYDRTKETASATFVHSGVLTRWVF